MREKGDCLLSPKVITKGYGQKGIKGLKENFAKQVGSNCPSKNYKWDTKPIYRQFQQEKYHFIPLIDLHMPEWHWE